MLVINREYTAREIAEILEGKIEGDPNVKVNKLSRIEEAVPHSLSFLGNIKYEPFLYSTNASIVIIGNDYHLKSKISPTLIRVNDPYKAFAKLLNSYEEKINKVEPQGIIENPCYISEDSSIGENVSIGAFTYVGKNVKIGKGSVIHPGCSIR